MVEFKQEGIKMKILKWILIVIVFLVLSLAAFLVYLGVFSTPQVTEQKVGPYTLVYEEYTGPYSNSGQVVGKVFNALKAEGIITVKGFGVYLDNPAVTASDKTRSYLGCVLEDRDLAKVSQLEKKFKVMQWKPTDCLVAEFPIRNNLSYMIGPMKVYPELNKAMTAKGYKTGSCMELYDIPAMKIFYLFEIVKLNDDK